MASKSSSDYLADGSFDWSGGVDSSKITTVQSELNPNGLSRNQLAWLFNGTVRNGGINQRTGFQPLLQLFAAGGRWQGGFMYEPDSANPYLICSISGHIYQALLEPPYTVTDLSALFGLFNPAFCEQAYFVQGENLLVIQAGDFETGPVAIAAGGLNSYGQVMPFATTTLPLFWDGTTLRRSRGITTVTPAGMLPNINEIPAATCMWYHGSRIWYAQFRQVAAGDIAGGPSGNLANHFRDAILSITENPMCFGGDGFSIPTNAGNIRALRDEINLNESVGNSRLLIWTRKSVFALSVPVTRTDWINAGAVNMPLIVPVQTVNGSVGDRCVVASNGDWFYQSFEPGIRSLITAVRYFSQWGNTPISQNENRALDLNDRSLMRFSSGILFNNRMLQLVMPKLAADGVNVIHQAILPLDFDVVTNLAEKQAPVWEGAYDGLQYLQVFTGDFGGLPRAFAVVISELDNSMHVWEMTTANRRENGDGRVTWGQEFPAFDWSQHGLAFYLKQLKGGELWVDKVYGQVDMDVFYREDADPCWRRWFHTGLCAARNCEEADPPTLCYPREPFREGYRFPVVFPEPPTGCDSLGIRPTTIGYQFQVRIIIKGWCRIRGLILYAVPKEKPQYEGVSCPASVVPQGMANLPNPFGQ